MGMVKIIKGVKRIKPRTKPAMVRPVRRSKIEPVMKKARRPMSWVEFGECWLSLWRNVGDEVGKMSAMMMVVVKMEFLAEGVLGNEGREWFRWRRRGR